MQMAPTRNSETSFENAFYLANSKDRGSSIAKNNGKYEKLNKPFNSNNKYQIRCLFALVVTLFIAYLFSTVILTAQLRKIQLEQRDIKKKGNLHEIHLLKLIGDQSGQIKGTHTANGESLKDNVGNTTSSIAVEKIIHDVWEIRNKTEKIQTISVEQQTSFNDQIKDVRDHIDEMSARVTNVENNFFFIMDRTENRSNALAEEIDMFKEALDSKTKKRIDSLNRVFTDIMDKVPALEHDLKMLMNETEKATVHPNENGDCSTADIHSLINDTGEKIEILEQRAQSMEYSIKVLTTKRDTCSLGWMKFSGSCYYFSNFTLNWFDALYFCQALNAHLVEIENAEEDTFIRSRLNSFNDGKSYWAGASDIVKEGSWEWVSSKRIVEYFNWAPNEPAGDGIESDWDCVQIWHQYNYQWDDLKCSRLTHFICEEEIN